jgi:hypothetical protein
MTRVHHPDSKVEVEAWGDHDRFECDDAEVWLDAETILVSYFDDEGVVVLEGRPDAEGGWELSARSRPRRASLRPIADTPGGLEGEIEEQEQVATWRLRLGVPEPH